MAEISDRGRQCLLNVRCYASEVTHAELLLQVLNALSGGGGCTTAEVKVATAEYFHNILSYPPAKIAGSLCRGVVGGCPQFRRHELSSGASDGA